MTKRIFLAINPPAEVRHEIWNATAPLRGALDGVKWVGEPKIHLTVKFIGAMSEESLPRLTEAIEQTARTHAAPVVSLRTVGAFPALRRPRVIWMGVEPEPKLELLQHDVEIACAELGFELDGRPFRPHLTLGRVHTPPAAEQAKALCDAAKRIRFTSQFPARTLDVMQSVSEAGGSVYEVLSAAPMKVS